MGIVCVCARDTGECTTDTRMGGGVWLLAPAAIRGVARGTSMRASCTSCRGRPRGLGPGLGSEPWLEKEASSSEQFTTSGQAHFSGSQQVKASREGQAEGQPAQHTWRRRGLAC
eukprot:CAMPEP_0181494430 /NCGR_PEP_ID=MMETSP1110-20121109/51765_1 /TAXON_ID=174948 /ORGANISM="Symbiodinium sp., Strain CCMP421" /LENGTH=113 /DNA_ID=CAMNT_0023621837 /DNA_START=175 /DNA_END=513 /DNA_ORIENTATION=-